MRPGLSVSVLSLPALALPAILSLAACNKQPEVSATNATPAQVQQKVATASGGAALTIEPGRWEGTTVMHDIQLPNVANMPPAVKAQMKAQMSATHSFVNCVTPEDVKKAFFTDRSSNQNCKFDHFTLSGGKIDAAMTCNSGRQGTMTMTMAGTYSSAAYHVDMTSKADGMPMGAMSMNMSIDAKRVGACRGTPDEK